MKFAFVRTRAMRAAILCGAAVILPVENLYAADVGREAQEGVETAEDSTKLAPEHRASLEPVLRGLLQTRVDVQERLPGQAAIIVVGNVSFSESGDRLVVELGKGYVPASYDFEFEDSIHELSNEVYAYMETIGPIYAVSFTFEGRDIFDYFPSERGPASQTEDSKGEQLLQRAEARKGRVLVSAGHGYYFHKKFGWTTQRSLVNGIIEDFATPAFAASLDGYLRSRSGIEIFRARSLSRERHAESGKPWTDVASRYFLKDMLPEHPGIWNSKPGEGGDKEEYKQDIRSRPLYGNHLGVDAAIHLHTNADDNPSLRGIRIYHFPGRGADKRLATVALCYIKESLRSNQAFETFPVASQSHEANHGENRYAEMPSVIAEVGFHTNGDDAAAIGSYVFRDLAMRGLEKGYRMFREGRGCEPFTVEHPDVNLVSDTPFKVDVVFGGAPRFPVKYEMAVTECTPGIICTPRYGRFDDPASPLTIDYGCTAMKGHPFTIKWDASFIDADGIKAKAPVTMTCKPKASRRA
jgi:N-acetylmuramoyl-L-alanine amidase